MRKTVLVPVEKMLCDAHIARDGSEEEAAETLTLGRHTWDLCLEHSVTFGRYLLDALGVPGEGSAPDGPEEAATAAPTAVAGDAEQQPEEAAEPAHTDTEDATDTADDTAEESAPEETPAASGPVESVMVCGEVPGYSWQDARDAVRNLGYEVVGRADDSTVLIICGTGAERNATKLRDARERNLPCLDATRPGAFADAVCAGKLTGSDPLPEPVKQDREGMSERERNRAVRRWARAHGFTVPDRGRIPMNVRHAYDLSQQSGAEGKAQAA
ncbi:hypothetical protein GCM10009716_33450 [Streptomyces sodiiphilus]|uniref:Lsr2 DNA-binding domain-containing protein n=2 Tax=Streptomyces sodiiphilus TaxID=226217 RepID=A0ABP5AUG7_9ACTN